jgi:hypothetical protein
VCSLITYEPYYVPAPAPMSMLLVCTLDVPGLMSAPPS